MGSRKVLHRSGPDCLSSSSRSAARSVSHPNPPSAQEEIEQYKQKPPSKVTDFYISETLMHNFTNAAILAAECLYDYYQTGELVVYDYIGENYDPVEYHIKNFIVTGNDLSPLLAELESVQSPEHWKYQGWASEKILQQWLAHIQSVQQTLKEHV